MPEAIVPLAASAASACAPLLAGPAEETYAARRQEPGWTLTIASGRIDYIGNYGEKRITVAAPIRARPSTAIATRRRG